MIYTLVYDRNETFQSNILNAIFHFTWKTPLTLLRKKIQNTHLSAIGQIKMANGYKQLFIEGFHPSKMYIHQ